MLKTKLPLPSNPDHHWDWLLQVADWSYLFLSEIEIFLFGKNPIETLRFPVICALFAIGISIVDITVYRFKGESFLGVSTRKTKQGVIYNKYITYFFYFPLSAAIMGFTANRAEILQNTLAAAILVGVSWPLLLVTIGIGPPAPGKDEDDDEEDEDERDEEH